MVGVFLGKIRVRVANFKGSATIRAVTVKCTASCPEALVALPKNGPEASKNVKIKGMIVIGVHSGYCPK